MRKFGKNGFLILIKDLISNWLLKWNFCPVNSDAEKFKKLFPYKELSRGENVHIISNLVFPVKLWIFIILITIFRDCVKLDEEWESVLKGQCHEIFVIYFLFHESKPSGPLINMLKWFCLKIQFCKDICEISDSAPC